MRRLLIMLAVLVTAGASQGLDEPTAPGQLLGRVHITDLDFYLDGGTVFFGVSDSLGHSLQGCFDHRVRRGGEGFPRLIYLGGKYPDRSGTRPLRLWGPEERALISLLHSTLRDSLTSEELILLQWAGSYREIGGASVQLWHFVKVVEARRRCHDALDRGYLMHEEDVARWFKVERALSILSISHETPGFATVVVSDAAGKQVTVGIPTEAPADSTWATGADFRIRHSAGSWEDRYTVSLVAYAISQSPESEATRALQAALERRRQVILSADAEAHLVSVLSEPTAAVPVQSEPLLPSIPILVAALDSTVRIETFILDGSAAEVDDATVPNIGRHRIVGTGPAPGVTLARRLIPIIKRAQDADCGVRERDECEFAPKFAIRFHATGTPLDLLVSRDCSHFSFVRGRWNASHWISDGRGDYLRDANGRPLPGLGRTTACIADSLLSICQDLFPEEYDSPPEERGRR